MSSKVRLSIEVNEAKKNIDELYTRDVPVFIWKQFQNQRLQLFELFAHNFDLSNETICLDVGGITAGFEGLNNLCMPVAVNLEFTKKFEGWNLILADARYLPIRQESIDIVLSNALLEHVVEGRAQLVHEIWRVSKGNLFVSVPYFFSPIEPHYHVPFFQFAPESVKKFLLQKIGLRIGHMNKENYSKIMLLRKSELKQFFPETHIYTLRIFIFPMNLIAIKRLNNR